MNNDIIFAIAGAKGGVGKTTTSINLASALRMHDVKPLVIELDLAMANIVDFLDLDLDPNSDPTLHGVLAGEVAPERAIYEAPGRFNVLPSGVSLDGFAETKPSAVKKTVDSLRSEYDVVLLDTGAGVSYETLLPISLADSTILVMSPRLAAVRDTSKTKELVDRVDGTVCGVVIVKSGTGSAPDSGKLADFLDADLFGSIPNDDTIPAAQDAGKPILTYDLAADAAKAYWDVAESLLQKHYGSVPESQTLPQP